MTKRAKKLWGGRSRQNTDSDFIRAQDGNAMRGSSAGEPWWPLCEPKAGETLARRTCIGPHLTASSTANELAPKQQQQRRVISPKLPHSPLVIDLVSCHIASACSTSSYKVARHGQGNNCSRRGLRKHVSHNLVLMIAWLREHITVSEILRHFRCREGPVKGRRKQAKVWESWGRDSHTYSHFAGAFTTAAVMTPKAHSHSL
jgi:hypothetical protein